MVAAPALMWVAAGISAAGILKQGMDAKRAGEANAAELQYQRDQGFADAAAEREGAQVRAGQIRKAGRYQQSEARASLAKSGVVVDSGSGQAVQDHIKASSEQDALTEILTGDYRARRMEAGATASGRQAVYADRAGSEALTGSLLRAGGTLGYAAASGPSTGWRTQVQEMAPGQFSTSNRQYG